VRWFEEPSSRSEAAPGVPIVNDYIDATLSAVFVLVVIATVIYGLISIRKALASPQATAMEIGFVGMVIGGRNA
jgi:hypothetical protein